MDRHGRGSSGSSIPISIKFKKLAKEDVSSSSSSRQQQREHPRKDRLQLESGKSTRESEIGPKRLKVKAPSFLGPSESSRLD